MKKIKRYLILATIFIVPLLSLGLDVSLMSHDFYMTGAEKKGSASIADGIIIVLVLVFSWEVYKFYMNQKRLREEE